MNFSSLQPLRGWRMRMPEKFVYFFNLRSLVDGGLGRHDEILFQKTKTRKSNG